MNEKELRERLRSYFKWDVPRLKVIEERLKEIAINGGMKGMTYDQPRLSESFKFHSATEDIAERNIEAYNEIIREHCRCELRVNEIKYALESLDEKEYKLIRMKYLDNASWVQIGCGIDYSERSSRGLHKKIITSLLEILK